MFHVPEFYPYISMRLAKVLEDIGFNERMILKRRRTWLLRETLFNNTIRLTGMKKSYYHFGSQSEGTTIQGLRSDTDNLISDNELIVIQDWAEWEPGPKVLMIQEETTPPGYCMLQQLYSNEPAGVGVTEIRDEHYVRYRGDKVLLKNNVHAEKFGVSRLRLVKNGAAGTTTFEGGYDEDYVDAFPLKTLPDFLSTWLQQQTQKGKISQDMKIYIESNPCYVVPVGKQDSSFKEAEWRISTSHAERCLMFNLNITHLQCYIMLKLLLKTHFKHPQEKALSSFMCKNILLLCIEKSHLCQCGPQNLLSVFTFVLLQLKQSISQKHCPHFIMHKNNLMARKFSSEVKRWLLEKIQFIYEKHGLAFLDIEIDDIGSRLRTRLNIPIHCIIVRDIAHDPSRGISGGLFYNLAHAVSHKHIFLLDQAILSGKNSYNGIITYLLQLNHHGNCLEQAASRLLTPLICSSLGSVIASRDINSNNSISPEALSWLSMGVNSDVASSRLKLASVHYCVGDFHTTETILSKIAVMYDLGIVEAVCVCVPEIRTYSRSFTDYSNTHNELSIRHTVAYCVKFTREEVHCQPQELQYEMFRSTQEDRAQRYKHLDFWMDWAEVDSLPYLYFLQYKTYGHLQKNDMRQQALNNLVRSIHTTRNIGHKETALNLLGQCYQKENRYTEALHCYMNSLRIRPTNNIAKLHICLLLFTIYTSTQAMQ